MADENVQTTPMDGNSQTQDSPVDLAAAFRLVNQANKETAPAPVAEGQTGSSDTSGAQGDTGSESIQDGSQSAGDGEPAASQDSGTSQGNIAGNEPTVSSGSVGENSRGYADRAANISEAAKYDNIKKSMLTNLEQYAQQAALEELKKNNVKTHWSVNDIFRQDPNTGTAKFIDPDTGKEITRREAQEWVESMNSQVQDSFISEYYRQRQLYAKSMQPMADLISFAPRYDSLPEAVRIITDELVEGYEIKDNNGDIIGYRCDLNAMADKAERMVKRYGGTTTQQKEPEKPQATGPAMDMQTSGSASSESFTEPKTVGEAMKVISQMKKGNNNG